MEAHPKSVLYRLLHMGFVDIREATRENFPIKALGISECLSELPLQLDCLLNSQESSASILNHLKSRLRNQRLGV